MVFILVLGGPGLLVPTTDREVVLSAGGGKKDGGGPRGGASPGPRAVPEVGPVTGAGPGPCDDSRCPPLGV